ncbi:MAG: PQQ-binding-like beta-propeller repeat protein [Planctomycetaceae bacterium]|nr:PQQ-binding-like beta-propeller repeat protein [Planctomycetaceae bacterium]
MKTRVMMPAALSMIALAAACAVAADWPNWRGSDHNGISTETGWLAKWQASKPVVLWKAKVGTGFSSIAVADSRVYTMGYAANRNGVYCFDAASGKELWMYSYAGDKGAKYYEGGPHATVAVDEGKVYAVSKWGQVFCLTGDEGKLLWQSDVAKEIKAETPTWAFGSSPIVMGKMLLINLGTSGVALDKTSGKMLWQSGSECSGYATPVPYIDGDKKCLAIFGKGHLYGVDAQTGKKLWQQPWQTEYDANIADPIVTGDKIFISTGYNKGCALVSIAGGQPKILWQNTSMRNHFNTSVLIDGHVYGFDESRLTCVNLADGKSPWQKEGMGKGSLMAADGKLIVLSEDGKLVIAEAKATAYKELLAVKILSGKCWTAPVLSGGRIYARNAEGDLVCAGSK